MQSAAPNPVIDKMKQLYQSFDAKHLDKLESIYTQDVEFIDPIHHIHGVLGLKRYLRNQMANIDYCEFEYQSEMIGEDKAFIRWQMHYRHPRLAAGKLLSLPGMSEIHFSDKIFYQQDSYDVGQMLYEHIPVMGSLIQMIKKRVQS